MTRSPAEIFAEVIRADQEALGYSVYVNHMPDQPDAAIMVFDQPSGQLEGRSLRSGDVVEHPVVQVIVRGPKGPGSTISGYTAISTVWGTVKQVHQQVLSQGEILQCITKTNTIGSLGLEPQTRRARFSQQFRMTFSE